MIKLVILGTHAGAELFADLVEDCPEFDLVAFAENERVERCKEPLLGRPVIWVEELAELADTHQALCAIATVGRMRFCRQIEAIGMPFATLRHPAAHVAGTATLGPDTSLSPGTVVATGAELGRHVLVNRGCLIGHHTGISDYVTLGPGVNIAGRVNVGEGTFIGMGASVLDRLTIGSGSVIGAGAVVTRDVPDRVQVLGVPAEVVRTEIEAR
jgi:sugar O-acyltransferase (sialic acid O-acetyltransferase NeuD family)